MRFALPHAGAASPAQHAAPALPHTAHTWLDPLVWHTSSSDAVQPMLAQQAWPAAPHAPQPASGHAPPQLELRHSPPPDGHAEPDGVQIWLMQQPPDVHADDPVQHACPGPPHGSQMLLLPQRPLAHVLPTQHVSPAAPQTWHAPLTHAVPD